MNTLSAGTNFFLRSALCGSRSSSLRGSRLGVEFIASDADVAVALFGQIGGEGKRNLKETVSCRRKIGVSELCIIRKRVIPVNCGSRFFKFHVLCFLKATAAVITRSEFSRVIMRPMRQLDLN